MKHHILRFSRHHLEESSSLSRAFTLERQVAESLLRQSITQKNLNGHGMALMTILIWGTTFISTKVLLQHYSPTVILYTRFTIGFIGLYLIKPKLFKPTKLAHETLMMLAGLSGVTLYYLLENTALRYTFASNVGVIISAAPFFTGILAAATRGERLNAYFFAGFTISFVGILIISFKGISFVAKPLGNLLALAAALASRFHGAADLRRAAA